MSTDETKEAEAPKKRVVTLKRPATLGEGAAALTVSEIDLSGLDNLTGADALFCQREAEAKKGEPTFYGVADVGYRLEVAAKASGLPVQLFAKLHIVDFERVDNVVKLFLSDSA